MDERPGFYPAEGFQLMLFNLIASRSGMGQINTLNKVDC